MTPDVLHGKMIIIVIAGKVRNSYNTYGKCICVYLNVVPTKKFHSYIHHTRIVNVDPESKLLLMGKAL